jgi:hypothetical protein
MFLQSLIVVYLLLSYLLLSHQYDRHWLYLCSDTLSSPNFRPRGQWHHPGNWPLFKFPTTKNLQHLLAYSITQ